MPKSQKKDTKEQPKDNLNDCRGNLSENTSNKISVGWEIETLISNVFYHQPHISPDKTILVN